MLLKKYKLILQDVFFVWPLIYVACSLEFEPFSTLFIIFLWFVSIMMVLYGYFLRNSLKYRNKVVPTLKTKNGALLSYVILSTVLESVAIALTGHPYLATIYVLGGGIYIYSTQQYALAYQKLKGKTDATT